MPKAAPDYMLDGSLERVASATRMYVCVDEPADFAAIAGLALAEAEMAPSDFTISNGVVSGRRVVVAAKEGMPITSSGEADHVVLADHVNSRLLYVTVCPPVALTAGGEVSSNEWAVEIEDPT